MNPQSIDLESGAPWSARRRFLSDTACCGLAAALGSFGLSGAEAAPVAPVHWPSDVQSLWQRVWLGVRPGLMADVHVHLLGHTSDEADGDDGAWINPRTLSPFAFGDWVRRLAIEHASAVSGHRAMLSEKYLDRVGALWADFPMGAHPLLLAFDATFDADGSLDPSRTMFRTGNAYARDAALRRGWGWIASIHPDRVDAIDRLQAAHAQGARAIKWLPSAMGIDPSLARYGRFYSEMARLDLPLLTHAGEEKAVSGANAHASVNPLLLRYPLGEGVRVIIAHCASLGQAADLDHPMHGAAFAFDLFSRLMDDASSANRVFGDISAITQINRSPDVLKTLLTRDDWHGRLFYGSDYPLPGLSWLTSVARLASADLIDVADTPALKALQSLNPLAFDFALKRCLRWQGRAFPTDVFETLDRLAPYAHSP